MSFPFCRVLFTSLSSDSIDLVGWRGGDWHIFTSLRSEVVPSSEEEDVCEDVREDVCEDAREDVPSCEEIGLVLPFLSCLDVMMMMRVMDEGVG